MALEQVGEKPGIVRLTRCPWCDAPLAGRGGEGGEGERPAWHLRRCRDFQEAWGGDPRRSV